MNSRDRLSQTSTQAFTGRTGATPVLYHRVLELEWDALPPALKGLHDVHSVHDYTGHADVVGADGLTACLIARFIGFPTSGVDVPVYVRLETDGTRETWTRTFGVQTFQSTQEYGTGCFAELLVERFGGFAFGMNVVVAENALALVMTRWSFLGLPLPRALAPRSRARESEVDGRFHFDVEISLPFVGRLVRYTGTLIPTETDFHSTI